MSKSMLAKQLTIAASALLLLAAQLIFAIHELEHIAEPAEQTDVCKLCMAANGLDQPTSSATAPPPPADSYVELGSPTTPAQSATPSLFPPARGPPLSSVFS